MELIYIHELHICLGHPGKSYRLNHCDVAPIITVINSLATDSHQSFTALTVTFNCKICR